jgi:hypothetical protein
MRIRCVKVMTWNMNEVQYVIPKETLVHRIVIRSHLLDIN